MAPKVRGIGAAPLRGAIHLAPRSGGSRRSLSLAPFTPG